MKIPDNLSVAEICPRYTGQRDRAAPGNKAEPAQAKAAGEDRVSLSGKWPGGCTLAMEEASRIPDSGEAEARVLFARHQLETEPARAASTQANLDKGRALLILSRGG